MEQISLNLDDDQFFTRFGAQQRKIKILCYSASVKAPTGFGSVNTHIMDALAKTGKYDIRLLGINYYDGPCQLGPDYHLYPVCVNNDTDPYGRQHVIDIIKDYDYDILFLFEDSFILRDLIYGLNRDRKSGILGKLKSGRGVSVAYIPIDSIPNTEWIEAFSEVDVPIVYNKFGFDRCFEIVPSLIDRMKIINHGVSITDFHPLPKNQVVEFHNHYFKGIDKQIITCVSRNQQRKNIPHLLVAFKRLLELRDDVVLYLHCAAVDQGNDLFNLAGSLGLSTATQVILPQNFNPGIAYPIDVLNKIYNCSSVFATATYGEGWFCAITESFATKLPVVAPRNTSLIELLADSRGFLYDSGSRWCDYIGMPGDGDVLRPLPNLEDLVSKLDYVLTNREEASAHAEIAYKWVLENLEWSKIKKQWVQLFSDVSDTILSGDAKQQTTSDRVKGILI